MELRKYFSEISFCGLFRKLGTGSAQSDSKLREIGEEIFRILYEVRDDAIAAANKEKAEAEAGRGLSL